MAWLVVVLVRDATFEIIFSCLQSEDLDNALVLRLYESFGGHTKVKLTVDLPFTSAKR